MATSDLLGLIAASVGPAIDKSVKAVIPTMFGNFGDNNKGKLSLLFDIFRSKRKDCFGIGYVGNRDWFRAFLRVILIASKYNFIASFLLPLLKFQLDEKKFFPSSSSSFQLSKARNLISLL